MMSSPVLFYGEDSKTNLEAMRLKSVEILKLSSPLELDNCPDYLEAFPTSKSFTYNIETIQILIKQCFLPPYNGKKRVIALTCIERMLKVHINALLKTLEEMPDYCYVFLTTTRKDDILKTLLSRVQKNFVKEDSCNLNYLENIQETINLLEAKKYDSFFKKIELLEKEITEKPFSLEKKLNVFLQTYSEIFFKKIEKKHLTIFYSEKIDVLIKKTFTGQFANIKIKHLLENLFLESQLLYHNNQ